MYSRFIVMNICALFGTTIIALHLVAGDAAAEGRPVTVANRVDLELSPDPDACSEKALGEAIRYVKSPPLTQVDLDTFASRRGGLRDRDASTCGDHVMAAGCGDR
jgi:hypothetical protein